jgi:hypothetical protein
MASPRNFLMAALAAGVVMAAAEPTRAAADLVPIVTNLATGEAGVINVGDADAGPSVMTVSCAKIMGAGSCAESAGMAAYENAAYPNQAVIPVPALPAGESFTHQLAFWDELVWEAGTYQLVLTVDAGGTVGEGDEFNNQSSTQMQVLKKAVGSPVPKGPQTLTAAPAGKGKDQKQVAFALPDIVATTIGFVAGSGPVGWGHTLKIDKPHMVDATRSGPNKDLCVIEPAAFRTFNKGPVATGPFKSTVYREGTVVRTQAIPALPPQKGVDFQSFPLPVHEGMNIIRAIVDSGKQVAESDEQNTYVVRIDVAIDCNGDGKPAPLKLKSQ